MIARRRALHIAPITPARSGNGLAMRQGMFLEALSQHFATHLVVLPVAGGSGAGSSLSHELDVRTSLIPVAGRQDTHFSLLARLADPSARAAAFRSYGRSSLAAHLSLPVLAELRATIGGGHYDLIHIGRSYLADALDAVDGARVTIDLDEDEWTSYTEVATTVCDTDPAGAAWAQAEAAAMTALISRSAPRITQHFISSEFDAGLIRRRHPDLALEVIENAVRVPTQVSRDDDGATLLFLGSFGYAPNVDAVTWFVDDIWPVILARSQRPLRLLIVGRDAGQIAVLGKREGVEVAGEVNDVADVYARSTLFVAPLRAGAGTRLKLLEAAAHQVPIVTTSPGVRGLRFARGGEILVADDAIDFADAVLEALTNAAASAARAKAAFAVVADCYDRAHAVERLACRLRDIAAT
jgi:glycosyltransferase involved in cell wall biosynthesis